MIKKISLAILIVTFFLGCTRDDICDLLTDTTPILVITFEDINNEGVSKAVTNLRVETAEDSLLVFFATTTDSIAIPLKTGENLTKYLFTTRSTDTINRNSDIVTFNYMPEDVYLNRACAFKTIYNELSAGVDDEGTDNWIRTINVLKTTVENENETHITILH